jgi:molecular chaperone GrpE
MSRSRKSREHDPRHEAAESPQRGSSSGGEESSRSPDDAERQDAGSPEDRPSSAVEASLREQLEAAISDRDAHHDRWLRTQAEFENYRKRSQKESEQVRRYQALPLLRDLLPVLDNLHRALAAAESAQKVDDLAQGVRMVARQLEDLLGKWSAAPIEAVGRPFDPNLHEAIQQMPSTEHPPMAVVDEVERGWVLHDRVVRPSKVVVSSGPPEGEGGRSG